MTWYSAIVIAESVALALALLCCVLFVQTLKRKRLERREFRYQLRENRRIQTSLARDVELLKEDLKEARGVCNEMYRENQQIGSELNELAATNRRQQLSLEISEYAEMIYNTDLAHLDQTLIDVFSRFTEEPWRVRIRIRRRIVFDIQHPGPGENLVPVAKYEGVTIESSCHLEELIETYEAIARAIWRCAMNSYPSTIDPLTHLRSRRTILQDIIREVKRHSRHPEDCLSALFFDIDDFKDVNDNLGHAAGDDILLQMGRLLYSRKREEDYVGRLGGDEFLVVLPETSREKAYQSAERLRQRVQEHEFSYRSMDPDLGEVSISVFRTISIGIATFNVLEYLAGKLPDEKFEEAKLGRWEPKDTQLHDIANDLIRRADAAAYRSKRAGRNQVTSEPEPEVDEPLCG